MPVEDEAAELMAHPLQEFASRRNARARALKAERQGELAARVAALKKPPTTLWAVNQLARHDPAAIGRLGQAGEAVVQAQAAAVSGRANAAGELHQAGSTLQRELDRALGQVETALRDGGHARDEATRRRIAEMLRVAAVSGGETLDRLRRGALIEEPKAGADMLTAAFAASTPPGAATRATARAKAGDHPAASARARAAARSPAAAAAQQQEQERRLEREHAARTARMDDDRAREAEAMARRLRAQADQMAGEARRMAERARKAEREAVEAAARAKASQAAATRLTAKR
ncbi:MAG TPA: hypothetical protein VET65_14825 [Candidatus Limnocylindrales bacterium]|nr:hypothetical protein [Candidatus Limnocylindrales bacterium]